MIDDVFCVVEQLVYSRFNKQNNILGIQTSNYSWLGQQQQQEACHNLTSPHTVIDTTDHSHPSSQAFSQ